MLRDERFYESIFNHMLNGYAYHQILTDENNMPVDYVFLEVNKAFEDLTGFKREAILGKRVTEVLPGIEKAEFDWIGFYGQVALQGKKETFMQYSQELKKWYSVCVYSQETGYFSTIFNDVSELKYKEQTLIRQNEEITALYEELTASEEELKQQLDEIREYNALLNANEDRLKRAQEIAHVGNWELDLSSHMIWASEEAFHIYGVPFESHEFQLKFARSLVHVQDREKVDKLLHRLIVADERYDVEFRILRLHDGEERYIHSVAELVKDEYGKPRKILGVIRDMTEQKQAELKLLQSYEELTALNEELTASEEELKLKYEELNTHKELLRASEEKYRTLVESSHDLIYSCDVNGVFTAVNRKFCQTMGISADRMVGQKLDFLMQDEKIVQVWNESIKEVVHSKASIQNEQKFSMPDGSVVYYQITLTPIFNSNYEVVGIMGSYHDVTDMKNKEETIRQMAYYDALTGLPNRVLFTDRLAMAIKRAVRTQTKLAVVFLDIDNFKKVNDTLGHFVGDELLKAVGERLKGIVRQYETLARFSGDEFTLFIQDIAHSDEVGGFIERVKAAFCSLFMVQGNSIHTSVSMGISIFPDDGHDVNELLKNADTAMYKVKESGRNGYQFYNQQIREEISFRVAIENNLRYAIDNGELWLQYQPQFSGQGRKIRGMEALVRWNSKELGALPPLHFIPIAEDSGLIVPIGEWVLKTACKQNKHWHDTYKLRTVISVNISAVQLKHKDFLVQVRQALFESGLAPEYLELEITESVLIESFAAVIEVLHEIRKMGIKIALDDFGTGYSSLSYLKKLPINTLKIDKLFVEDITEDSQEESITGAIISLVHRLGLDVIAEGVETEEQMRSLLASQCDYFQGYLLGKPLSEGEFADC